MTLAYECSCHLNPPCGNCENMCPSCEGTGKIFVCRNLRGEIDYIDGSPTSETAVCENCQGEGLKF